MGNETMKFPDSLPGEPMLNTVGNRGFKWYSNWQQELFCCSRCGWVGTVSIDDLEDPTASGASNIPRFNEVKDLLRKKYGSRFKMLKPTEASQEWFCGDNAGKLFRLEYT